jgi:hypothetical protein
MELNGEFTWDPKGLQPGKMAEEKITIPNAALGDFVLASANANLWGTNLSGYVSGPNEVTVQLSSHRDYYIDFATLTIYVRVWKR